MIACIDVDYRQATGGATDGNAACVVVPDWKAAAGVAEYAQLVHGVADYVPGEFYRRELPCVLAVLALVTQPIDVIVVMATSCSTGSVLPAWARICGIRSYRAYPSSAWRRTRFAATRRP